MPQIAPWLDPQIVFHPINLGPIDLCVPADLDLFMDQYVDFYETYWQIDPAGTPFLASMDGKPMLATWSRGTRVSGPECLPRSTFENELSNRLGSYFQNGVYFASIIPPHGFNWADEFNRAFVGYTGGSYLIDGHVAVHKPGFWDLLDRYFARDGGNSYVSGWNQLLNNSSVRQVEIESWNEFTEGTGIFEADPTMAYWQEDGYVYHPDTWGPTARFYLDATAQKGAQFNNVAELDSVVVDIDPMPSSLALGESQQMQVIVRNTGDEQWSGGSGFALTIDWGNGFSETFPIDDQEHEIDQRDDPLFAGFDGYGGVFRGRPIVLDVQFTAPTLSGLYRPEWKMTKNGVAFGDGHEQVVAVGEADACSTQTAPTTVYATLGIPVLWLVRQLGPRQRTADGSSLRQLTHLRESDRSPPPSSHLDRRRAHFGARLTAPGFPLTT